MRPSQLPMKCWRRQSGCSIIPAACRATSTASCATCEAPNAAPLVRSGGKQLLHFADQFAQVDRLGEDFGVFGCARVRIERHGGEAGDEHDLDVRTELGG